MGNHASSLRLAAIVLCVLLLAGCGGPAANGPEVPRSAESFRLRVLPETYIDAAPSGNFSITTEQRGAETVVLVRVDQAQALKALYFELEYDADKLQPVGADALATLAPTERLATLTAFDSPGLLSHGQVVLNAQQAPGFSGSGQLAAVRFRSGPGRSAAAAPAEPEWGQVSWDASSHTLRWHYYNQGDYDQNGEVNVADLTPIAFHYLEQGPFAPFSVQEVIDGDSNGRINLADLTPIGLNFRSASRGYRIYRSGNIADAPTLSDEPSKIPALAEITLKDALGSRFDERLRFAYVLPEVAAGDYFWVRPFDESGEGRAYAWAGGSNELTLNLISAPLSGDGSAAAPYLLDPAESYQFEVMHSELGDLSTDPETAYTLDPPSAGSLTNADALLSLAQDFSGDFTVSATYFDMVADPQYIYCRVEPGTVGENLPPTAALAATPESGFAPLSVIFDAAASTDADGSIVSYEWDFDGDGSYDEISGTTPSASTAYELPGSYTARVRVTDDDGASATAEITISVEGNNAPTAAISATPDSGAPPLEVSLDASASNDADGSIVSFEWDLDNDGVYEENTGTVANTSTSYGTLGTHYARVRVTDNDGASAVAECSIGVGVTNWNVLEIAPTVWTGGWPQLVDAGGEPGMAYRVNSDDGGGAHRIAYRRATSAAATEWTAAQNISIPAADAAALADLTLVDGQPAALYQAEDAFVDGLYYQRAADSQGDAWGASVRLDNGNYSGFSQLQVVGGKPAVAYVNTVFDEPDSWTKVGYIRANDAQGANWGSPVYLDVVPEASMVVPSFDLLDGRPSIAYYNWYTEEMSVVQAVDALGAGWDTPRAFTDLPVGGYAPTLLAGSRLPLVGFIDNQAQLSFMPALDMQGASFADPVVLDARAEAWSTDYGVRLAWVGAPGNEVPAIAYLREGEFNGDLLTSQVCFKQAADAQGSSWLDHEVIYVGAWNCIQIEMIAINGEPYLAWSDTTTNQVMFANRSGN